MEIEWKFEPEKIAELREFVASQRDNALVCRRIEHHVEHPLQAVEVDWFWEVLVGALLTSQQPSGPDSYVVKFIRTKPFPQSAQRAQRFLGVSLCSQRPQRLNLLLR
jgi:hypothetical protein